MSSSTPDADSGAAIAGAVQVALISLGCPKNLVDSELMLGLVSRGGFPLASDPDTATYVIVNTCAFIRDAQEESIGAILELAARKRGGELQGLIVAGCLAERHGRELLREIPEIDALVGPGRLTQITAALRQLRRGGAPFVALGGFPSVYPDVARERTGAPHTAYVKIAEGCDHHCTFCLIPRLRGPQRSRPPAEIADEVAALAAEGVREVVLVAQDTTAYGRDLAGPVSLAALLRRLRTSAGPDWIRVLYTHPAHWDEELIDVFAAGLPLLPYIDIPIQHVSRAVLRAMGRGRGAGDLRGLLERLRRRIPDAVLRTTVMTGHPGEGVAEFKELLGFIRQFPFDRLGAFAYSPEQDTAASRLPPRASAREAERRRGLILAQQREIAHELQLRRRGRQVRVLVEGIDPARSLLVGRSYAEAPEIDGVVYVKVRERSAGIEPGEMVAARIVAAGPYDLVARPVDVMGEEA